MKLGTIIFCGFLPSLLIRRTLEIQYVDCSEPEVQPRRAFMLDFALCLLGAVMVSLYNYFVLGFPAGSLLSLVIGCVIGGFFIGLDASLLREREVILDAMEHDRNRPLPTRIFPLTKKYTLVSITALGLVSLVLIMVFVRDIEWLVKTSQDAVSMNEARMSVLVEVVFIMGVLLLLIMNLIASYSKNLKLLFSNQTRILEQVREGDLSRKVPVATSDEFGVIAGHTNHMIEGLRHRFELINALQFAEEVQQNLLPSKSPYLREFDVSGYSLYCDQTGGDYFDYFLLPDDRFGIAVADACGHGVGAAMLMTSVRAYMIAEVQNYKDPASLINGVNKVLVKDCSANSTFTTLFFLELDQSKKTIRWVRAGHEPAVHFHAATGEFTELGGPGLVLGIEESFRFEYQSLDKLDSGDVILIGTDGIHETFNSEQVAFGKERVQKSIQDNHGKSAREIKDALVEKVRHHRGDLPQEDDITLVVIKVK